MGTIKVVMFAKRQELFFILMYGGKGQIYLLEDSLFLLAIAFHLLNVIASFHKALSI